MTDMKMNSIFSRKWLYRFVPCYLPLPNIHGNWLSFTLITTVAWIDTCSKCNYYSYLHFISASLYHTHTNHTPWSACAYQRLYGCACNPRQGQVNGMHMLKVKKHRRRVCMGKVLCVEFQRFLCNSTQNIVPIHWKIFILHYNLKSFWM